MMMPEKRDIEQITFPNEADAKAARAKIDAGTSFARSRQERRTEDRPTSRSARVVKDDLGKDADPPRSRCRERRYRSRSKAPFGWVLLHVTKITPGVEQDASTM